MDKNILRDYIDACQLIKDTEEDIRDLKQRRKTIVTDSVKGSMNEFPYAAQNFKIEGLSYTVVENPGELKAQEAILIERKANAEKVKTQVEAWMNTIPMRMQRIIRLKHFERQSWDMVAAKMGRDASGEALRKELENFLKESYYELFKIIDNKTWHDIIMTRTLGKCNNIHQQIVRNGVNMDREEILRKSQAEKQDEGKAYTFACGRKSGVIGMMCAFIFLSVYYLYTGNKEQAYPLVTITFAYLTCESIGIFYATKRKMEIIKICIGLLTCIYFLILSLT